MQKSFSKDNSSRLLFYIPLIFSIIFIAGSAFLLSQVNDLRTKVSDQVKVISRISEIQKNSFEILNGLNKNSQEVLKKKINQFKSNHKQTSNNTLKTLYSDIQSLNPEVARLKSIRMELIDINEDCKALISKKRQQLGVYSAQLSNYWDYTHIIIVAACVLTIILSFLGYSIKKTQSKLASEKNQKDFLYNNSIDCVITADNEGKIIGMNKIAETTFGYEETELHKEGLHVLYEDYDEYIRVLKSLEEKGAFKGEILNKSKSGTLFTCFLSANQLYDQDGNVVGSMGVSRDISEQKKVEENLGSIVNNLTDVIHKTNVEGTFEYVNDACFTVLGYKREEMEGSSFDEYIHRDDVDQVRKFYLEQFKSQTSETELEFRVITKKKEIIWVRQNTKAIYDRSAERRLTGFYSVLTNIDERKKAEQELEESEEKYRELIDNTSVLIQVLDNKGNFEYVNEAWLEKLGYSIDDLKQLNLFDIINMDSQSHCRNLFQQIMELGYCKEEKPIYQINAKNQTVITVQGNITVNKDKNGIVVGIHSFLHDITNEIETKNKLQKSEANFRQITETLNDVVFLYNVAEQKYEYISPNCEEIIGAPQSFFYNRKNHTASYVHPDDQASVDHAKVLVEAGKDYDIEYRIVVNKQTRWINEKSFPIKDEHGNVVRNSGVCRDITNAKIASEKIKTSSAKINRSINYAKNIQQAALPSDNEVKKILPESFLFYSPKHILSGDFYLVDRVRTNDQKVFPAFLVADCTGHGVPGAILSLLCNALIQETLSNSLINTPAEALDYVRERIIRLFQGTVDRTIYDGMDLAFCVINYEQKKLYFAGAQNPCIIVRDGEVMEFKGDRLHIGYSSKEEKFTHQEIDIKKGDCVYIFSDGFVDQFGGPKNKKFLKKRLYALFEKIHKKPLTAQYEEVNNAFFEWKKDEEQTDDITLMGVRI